MNRKLTTRAAFNRLMGLRSAKKKRHVQIIPTWHRPFSAFSKGKAGTALQGVGGWRNNYYRPHEVVLEPEKRYTVTYKGNV